MNLNSKKLPTHVAFIVDGSRRWARKRNLPLIKGHERAANKVIRLLILHCLKLSIPYITFWCWSTENWKRGKRFAEMIFAILKKGLQKNMDEYIKAGIRLKTIGDLSKVSPNLVAQLKRWQEKSKTNKKLTVTIGLNYGGRDEILRAVKKISLKPRLKNKKLTKREFEKYLDTWGTPDPDLIIRTGGEQRLSGFLLWQSEYAEFYFPKTFFPAFTIKEFDKALRIFKQRKRRFGK